jgi:hypothetical protein
LWFDGFDYGEEVVVFGGPFRVVSSIGNLGEGEVGTVALEQETGLVDAPSFVSPDMSQGEEAGWLKNTISACLLLPSISRVQMQ